MRGFQLVPNFTSLDDAAGCSRRWPPALPESSDPSSARRACDIAAGHRPRAGLATSAAIAGVEERAIMAQTRHRSVAVAQRYIRDGSLFRGNAAAAVGL